MKFLIHPSRFPLMLKSTDTKVMATLLVGLAFLLLIGRASIFTLQQFEQATEVRSRTHEVMQSVTRLHYELKNAETSRRSYVHTNNTAYLVTVKSRIASIPATLKNLDNLILDERVRRRFSELEPLVLQHLKEINSATAADTRSDQPTSFEEADARMEQIRSAIEGITALQATLLAERNARVDLLNLLCLIMILMAIALTIAMAGVALWFVQKDKARRRQAQRALSDLNHKLELQVAELNSRSLQATTLRAMMNQLQACHNQAEASLTIARYAEQLFPGSRGALFTYNASRDLAESIAVWGNDGDPDQHFHPQDCWALRLGHEYQHNSRHRGLRCAHVDPAVNNYMCLPMLAQGDAMGMLHLEYADGKGETEVGDDLLFLAGTVADQVAPALANLKLREILQQQSIRYPLTRLYNRRFLDENINRELKRAQRRETQFGVIMIDLDHFKRLNDNYGHEAGDAVLAAVGQLLLSSTRPEDICCRYGGEELAVVLPDTSHADAVMRAEELCSQVRNLRVRADPNTLMVTASFGVASYPQHGTSREEVVRAADTALYLAKNQGRNRVVSAGLSDPGPKLL